MKKCSVCKIEKHPEEFYSDPRLSDGVTSCCRMCKRAKNKGRHKKHSSAVKSPEKERVRGALRWAVKKGTVIKPSVCSQCHIPTPKQLLDGHHHDYDKPLEVTWLCRSCHGLQHMSDKTREAEARRLRGSHDLP